jgi:putative ABC transport system permease protein
VVKDFHYSWLKREIGPLLLRYEPSRLHYAFVRLAPGDRAGAISSIEHAWQRVNGDATFRYQFLDIQISEAYADFNDIARLMSFVAGMAIFISCLGLLGMALHSAESRRKEIGVRKVLGASAAKIALLLSKDFAKLLAISVAIAAPIAWFLGSRWLNNFAYRIDFGSAIIILGIALTAILALATIASQTAKAALANPVESLRYE